MKHQPIFLISSHFPREICQLFNTMAFSRQMNELLNGLQPRVFDFVCTIKKNKHPDNYTFSLAPCSFNIAQKNTSALFLVVDAAFRLAFFLFHLRYYDNSEENSPHYLASQHLIHSTHQQIGNKTQNQRNMKGWISTISITRYFVIWD